MTTTPTAWSAQITITTDINAFRPQITALADNTFIYAWEASNDLFARHLNEFGSFTSGNFLTGVSANPKPLFNPSFFQQADGRVVLTNGELDANPPPDDDIHWASIPPTFLSANGSFPIEQTGFDEVLIDSTARSDGVGAVGGAVIYEFTGPGNAKNLVLRFIDAVGNQASNQIFVGPHTGELQQNPSLAGRHTGFVTVAYQNTNLT